MLRRIIPRELLEIVIPTRSVRRPHEADPVGHRSLGHGGGEAIGVPDDPGRENTPARAAVYEEIALVDVAAAQQRVHAHHEVVVVHGRIGVVDRVAELAPVAGASAGVRVEDHVVVSSVVLVLEVESGVVHRVRTTVDAEDQGILP